MIGNLQLPIEIIVFLMLCSGYIFHYSWAKTLPHVPYNGYLVNAIYAITTRPTNCAFCFHMMCGILFGSLYYVTPVGSLNNPEHESQQLSKGGSGSTRQRTSQTFGIYIQGPHESGMSLLLDYYVTCNSHFFSFYFSQPLLFLNRQIMCTQTIVSDSCSMLVEKWVLFRKDGFQNSDFR